MKKSHLLINCEHGAEELVGSRIAEIAYVKNVERTTGYYDLVVELESNNEQQFKKILETEIRNIPPVRSILTLNHA